MAYVYRSFPTTELVPPLLGTGLATILVHIVVALGPRFYHRRSNNIEVEEGEAIVASRMPKAGCWPPLCCSSRDMIVTEEGASRATPKKTLRSVRTDVKTSLIIRTGGYAWIFVVAPIRVLDPDSICRS